MLRHLIAAAFLSITFASAASATTCPTNPYTLTNGVTADAIQVMSNFNNLLTCANSSLAPLASPSFTGNVGIATTTPQGVFSAASTGIGGHTASLTSWSSQFSTFGPNVGTASGAALGIGYDTTDDSSAIYSLAPNVSWKALYFNAANYNFYLAAAANPALAVTSLGSVGIGTASPAVTLAVVGNIRVGTFGTNGCVQNFAGTALTGTCSSDARLKTVAGTVDNVLDGLSRLKLVRFYWNKTAASLYHNATTVLNTGYIAQSVQQQFPELVSHDQNGYRQIDYTDLSLYGLEAIKELKRKNDEQAAQVAILKLRLDELEQRIASLAMDRRAAANDHSERAAPGENISFRR